MENIEEHLSGVSKNASVLDEQVSILLNKAEAYDKLDQKFRLICNEGIQGVLQNIAQYGLAHKKITEQQALNRLAERFPMTPEQIVSALEMRSLPTVQYRELQKDIPDPVVDLCLADFYESYKNDLTQGLYDLVVNSIGKAKESRTDMEKLLIDCDVDLISLLNRMKNGYTVKKERRWLVKSEKGFLTSFSIGTGSSVGWTGNADKYNSGAILFEKHLKAVYVARLVDGKVVPEKEKEK